MGGNRRAGGAGRVGERRRRASRGSTEASAPGAPPVRVLNPADASSRGKGLCKVMTLRVLDGRMSLGLSR